MSRTAGTCAIVGGGLAGFTAYVTLRHGGLGPEEIVTFTTEENPAAAWSRCASAIRQQRMRSESDGHCAPTSFPGLAVRDAVRRRTPLPLLASVSGRYRPTVADFLAHVDELRLRTAWDSSVRRRRVERIRAVSGGFEVDGEGPIRHVLLALGHPGLNLPDDLREDPRVVHAYEPHRVRKARSRGRRRHGRSHRMDERADRWRRGCLHPATRTRAAAAEHSTAAVHSARFNRLSQNLCGGTCCPSAMPARPVVPTWTRLGCTARTGCQRGALQRRRGPRWGRSR